MTFDCGECEERMHAYLDRMLDDGEVEEAERHLDACPSCRRRYRFEESLRSYIRLSADERLPPGLLAKLDELRGHDLPQL